MKLFIFFICAVIYFFIIHCCPWFDFYTDGNKKFHIILWYNGLDGTRKYYKIL